MAATASKLDALERVFVTRCVIREIEMTTARTFALMFEPRRVLLRSMNCIEACRKSQDVPDKASAEEDSAGGTRPPVT